MVSGDVDANIGKMMPAFAFWRSAKREIGNLKFLIFKPNKTTYILLQ